MPRAEFGAAALAVFRHALAGAEEPAIGLPTGRTPVEWYDEMAAERFTFPAGSKLFAIDEYCAIEPHPGTNAAFFERHLNGAGVRVPRHDAAHPASEMAAFCRAIRDSGGLDVAVLGIGMNGHIAFNEPGSGGSSGCRVVELAASTRAQVADDWQPAPTHGMTVGMAELLSADRIILLADGAAKATIVAAALDGPVTPDVPASFLQQHANVTIVCDIEAAARLRR